MTLTGGRGRTVEWMADGGVAAAAAAASGGTPSDAPRTQGGGSAGGQAADGGGSPTAAQAADHGAVAAARDESAGGRGVADGGVADGGVADGGVAATASAAAASPDGGAAARPDRRGRDDAGTPDSDSAASATAVSYLDIMRRKQEVFRRRLAEYLENPGEEQIHDLRTSTRRMEATYDALPKSAKTRETKKFMSMAKSLFKRNSRLRDCDVIAEALLKLGVPEDSPAVRDLVSAKARGLQATLADAKALSALAIPELGQTQDGKAGRRHRRCILSLLEDVRRAFPVIAADASRVEELHAMRKTIKRLRYLLEDDQDRGPVRDLQDGIKKVQELMGRIHDYDIVLQYIRDNPARFSGPEDLSAAVHERRKKAYKTLIGR